MGKFAKIEWPKDGIGSEMLKGITYLQAIHIMV